MFPTISIRPSDYFIIFFTDIDECLSNPCHNGATCSDVIDFYNCSCIPGFDGVNCENGKSLLRRKMIPIL